MERAAASPAAESSPRVCLRPGPAVPGRGEHAQGPHRGVGLLLLLAAASPAAAYPYGLSPPVLASGPSPFAGRTIGGPGTNYPNAEVEPFVAVNPTNPANLIGVYQQDRWSNGGATAWPPHTPRPAGWGTLPGGPRSDTSELHSFAFRGQPIFSRTTDGGATWSPPMAMSNHNVFTLGNQIGVLPDGTLVDIFWAGRGSGGQPSPNPDFIGVMISKDAGLHWSPPIKVS